MLSEQSERDHHHSNNTIGNKNELVTRLHEDTQNKQQAALNILSLSERFVCGFIPVLPDVTFCSDADVEQQRTLNAPKITDLTTVSFW